MRLFLLLLTILLNFVFVGQAAELTRYAYAPDRENSLQGSCYQIDNATGGKEYLVKVALKKCRPDETTFRWVQHEGVARGRCYEVDVVSRGERYAKSTQVKNCIPANIVTSWSGEKGGYRCYLGDAETGGKNFLIKVDKKRCQTAEIEYLWELSSSGLLGVCYAVDKHQGKAGFFNRVDKKKCRPANVRYEWLQKASRGQCYEVDAQLGAKGYIASVSKDSCLNKVKREYIFSLREDGVLGDCYEVVAGVEPAQIISKSNIDRCRLDDLITIFRKIRVDMGYCLEVDRLTGGQRFAKKIALDNCHKRLDGPTAIVWLEQEQLSIKGCFEVDKKSSGDQFIRRVNKKYCLGKERNIFKWFPSDDGMKGRCMEARVDATGASKYYSSNRTLCRPMRTKIIFINSAPLDGKCYEVHAQQGRFGYIGTVKDDLCIPAKTAYRFYHRPGESAGKCYLVDQKSNGLLYNQETKNRHCYNILKSKHQKRERQQANQALEYDASSVAP
ncbi:MAG: hypothetical protein HN353_14275 [Bdellovibrionales bacterium]|jgi:hypothetical protein|nr:hypothetical protein [Bdellovibrionales bacterium]MBT3526992.1 hypothetical protein [Bdellovibrionales bacterium]MBT7765981.1 hypothetical protein [Bdellovibrionales bacterium]